MSSEIEAADVLMDKVVDLLLLLWSDDFTIEEKQAGINPLLHDLGDAIRAYREARGLAPAKLRLVKGGKPDA